MACSGSIVHRILGSCTDHQVKTNTKLAQIQLTPDYPGRIKPGSIWFKRKLKINLENLS
jgi:hypothetical protein